MTFEKQGTGVMAESFEYPGLVEGEGFQLVQVRCHFVRLLGSGAAEADVVFEVDSPRSTAFNVELYRAIKRGLSDDLNMGIEESERVSRWVIPRPDKLKVSWANPDTGNVQWTLSMKLEKAA